MDPFPGFAVYPTHHCVTGSLKHLYDFHGRPVSEDMLLGLGAGLGFVYFHIKGADPFYGGRANVATPHQEGLERTAGRRTGVAVTEHATGSSGKGQAELRAQLEAGAPVLVYVDMGLLPYFDLPPGYHFGGHVVVVAGYDPATGEVLIADRDPTLHPVAWADLEAARGSGHRPFPPRHTWYELDFAAAREPEPAELGAAIAEVCQGMLAPPIANLGVPGIRKAVRETLRWPRALDEDAVRRTCFNVALFIDHRGGTGGGIFRYMYARFLGEAAERLDDPRLAELGAELEGIGDRWEDVADGFARAAEADHPAERLEAAVAPMPEIADREQDLFERLAVVSRASTRPAAPAR